MIGVKYKRSSGDTYSIIPEESDCNDGNSFIDGYPIDIDAVLNQAPSTENVERFLKLTKWINAMFRLRRMKSNSLAL